MKKTNNKHTFVICAYKEQPYLDDCIKSLKKQTLKSEIIVSTSTPNKMIEEITRKNKVKLVINTKTKGHINDFCFAYNLAKTKYVTLCHQDDIYYEDFAEKIVNKMEKEKAPIIGFANYNELRDGKTIKHNFLLIVKRLINFPLLLFKKSKKIRLFTLSLGNAICAPSVTYNKEIVKSPLKQSDLKANIDWNTYIDFARENGSFVYVSKALLEHRIHEGSTTTKVINNNIMKSEDYIMFRKFWPKSISKLLTNIYSTSEKSNSLKKKEKGEHKMLKIALVILYLVLTVSGLILYKYGSNKAFDVSISNNIFNLKLSLVSILGLVCYLLSFLLYMVILPRFDISRIMPITSAVSYIAIFALSVMILKESVTANGVIGAIIILVGLFIMNIKG